jgi:hypothetical protein
LSFSGSVVLEKVLNNPPIFCIFIMIPLLKRDWLCIWTILNFSLPKNALKIGCWFWRFFFYFSGILFFCYYLPLEKDVPFIWRHLFTPTPKGDLCKVGLIGLLKKITNVIYRQTDWQQAIRNFQLHLVS